MFRMFFITLGLVTQFQFFAQVSTPTGATGCETRGHILTLRPWYYGLTVSGGSNGCKIKDIEDVGGFGTFLWRIVLNIIEDIFQISGYIAAGYVIYGGFLFMTSAGIPERAVRGRKTIINSLIGLVIVIAAVGIVNFVRGAIF